MGKIKLKNKLKLYRKMNKNSNIYFYLEKKVFYHRKIKF